MNLASRLLVIASIPLMVACSSSPTEPFTYGHDGLQAVVAPPELTVSNESGQTIRYVVLERDMATLAMVCLCPGGPTLARDGRITLAYSAISGYEPGRENVALIYWAVVTSTDEGPVAAARIKVVTAPL